MRLYRGMTLNLTTGNVAVLTAITKERKEGRTNYTTMMTYKVIGNDEEFKVTKRRLMQLITPDNRKIEPEAPPVVPADVVREEVAASVRSGSLAELIASEIAPYVKSGVDAAEVHRLVDARIVEALLPRRIETILPGTGIITNVGVQHAYFEALLRMARQRVPVWLVGPAGSGKTSIAGSVARALGLQFRTAPVCTQTSEGKLVGFTTAGNGTYVKTHLRECYENGGVFLLDECDAGNASIMLVLNSLIAQDEYAFPDAVVQKHPDFTIVAGANTAGSGASREYNGRNQLDGATLDRFAFLPLPYDPTIEAVMCGVSPSCFSEAERITPFEFVQVHDAADPDNDRQLKEACEVRCGEFVRKYIKARNAANELGVRHIIGPRCGANGCRLIRAGFLIEDVMRLVVWKGASQDTIDKITAEAGI